MINDGFLNYLVLLRNSELYFLICRLRNCQNQNNPWHLHCRCLVLAINSKHQKKSQKMNEPGYNSSIFINLIHNQKQKSKFQQYRNSTGNHSANTIFCFCFAFVCFYFQFLHLYPKISSLLQQYYCTALSMTGK